ncbi:hypothetical protein M514_26021, partial [Trichuris suis]
ILIWYLYLCTTLARAASSNLLSLSVTTWKDCLEQGQQFALMPQRDRRQGPRRKRHQRALLSFLATGCVDESLWPGKSNGL